MTLQPGAVVDTNVFVGAGFNPQSASRRVLDRVRNGELGLIWNHRTRDETARVLDQIPRLDWAEFEDLFRAEHLHAARLDLGRYAHISGELDREFMALAESAQCALVSNDSDLLGPREQAAVPVLTPSEFLARCRE